MKRRRLALSQGVLSISFDDFPRTSWSEGGAVLADHQVQATYFMSGGLCGRFYANQEMFTTRDLEEIWAAGHEIGCHTFDHLSAIRSSPEEFVASMIRNRQFIGRIIAGLTLRTFAYPFGHVTLGAKLSCAKHYAFGRGIGRALNRGLFEPAFVGGIGFERRQMVQHDLPRLIEEAARCRGWLVVFSHDVRDDPSDYGCRPRDLDSLIRMAKNAGLAIRPVGRAIQI
jgi:peptidoglycan/xylan/chitin deacetylase (PgdA/CDA1 family)